MNRNSDFQTVHTEGGLLPADQLRRIVATEAAGTSPADYDLPPGETINEAISQSWSRLCKYWADFQESRSSLPDDQAGTDITNQKWLLPLFRELGYGKLTTSKSPEIEGKTYPITRFYSHLPIHFVGCNIKLDKRSPGVKGAATSTPHGLVQEFLNRSDEHLWAVVSNGRQLRILRDNVALSRQSYVEFDLEGMFDGEAYSDFALLWMVCHVTRTEGERPELCWLEKWSSAAREQGTRVLEDLRNGVERSIEALGRGFISHPANDALRQKLRNGDLDKQVLYHQILRTVYRLLFLFVAEDRNLLHTPETSDEARALYDEYYSTRRLRDMAEQIKGSRHTDLWHVLSLTFQAVSGEGETEAIRTHLGLPALGSRLWRLDETPDISGPGPDVTSPVLISNDDLLDAIRHLAYVQQERTLQSVNYRDLGSEELGSVYESLLELQPDIHVEARKFELRTVAGSERKTTGSYYTPDSLVQCLLDSALEPVIADRLGKANTAEDKQQALLDLKVCDPACGSGHFLIGAAHRIARHLASLRAIAEGEAEPTPDVYQHALRDVIAHCVYGVDINPMAVELCKVSLWLEALDPGRPLAFLDHHIQCGNSLLGTTPALIAKGIPDDAFKPIEGDDKEACKQLKAENKSERKGQRRLWGAMPSIHLGNMAQTFANIDAEDDSTPEALAAKEKHYQEFVSSAAYENARFLADAWCAAFVWPKTDPRDPAVTTETIRRIEDNPHEYPPGSPIREGVRKLARQYQFFHWHLVFPDVFHVPAEGEQAENEQTGWSGGFDCVLGNPPWERIKLQEKEFFAARDPEVANAPNVTARKVLIDALQETNPALYSAYKTELRKADGESTLLRNTGKYPLSGRGDVNTYAVFAELKRTLLALPGRVGCIVPSGIATDDTTKLFFQDIIATNGLLQLISFENTNRIFPEVKTTYRFCLLTMARHGRAGLPVRFAFFLTEVSQALDSNYGFTLTNRDIARINPNTKTCPIFRTDRDAKLLAYVHGSLPILWTESVSNGNVWGIRFQRMIDIGKDASLLVPVAEHDGEVDSNELRPTIEDWMIHHFDYRYQADGGTPTTPEQHKDPLYVPKARYLFNLQEASQRCDGKQYFYAYRKRTNASDSRTVIGAIVPQAGVLETAPIIYSEDNGDAVAVCAMLSAYALDYCARQSIGGMNLNYFILKQLPCIGKEAYAESKPFVEPRVLELTYTAWDMEPFGRNCGYDGPPFIWDEERRFLIRCELDAAFFHLYLGTESEWRESGSKELLEYFPTPRHAVEYIMETFPIVKRKDEEAHGHYRTKDTILEIYDEMAEAIAANEAARAAGQPATAQYQTRLDPPPGPPTDESGNFIPYADWTPEIHERYKGIIHPSKAPGQ